MEDVLDLYAGPHDPRRPVVCFDEAGRELRGDVTPPAPPAPGVPGKEDYEYTRHGTANPFVVVEPLAGVRQVTATDRRTAADFAAQMKARCDDLYPTADVIRVVLDDLNTHAFGSRFAAFPPGEAWRLKRRLESHSTPRHASWLNMAECEPGVLAGQCLDRRIPSREELAAEVTAWVTARNAAEAKLNWTFRVADARKKPAHLYPPTPQR